MITPLDRSSSVPLCVLCMSDNWNNTAAPRYTDNEAHGGTKRPRQPNELDRWTSDTKVTR
jgi:hypothetical protein